MPVCFSVRFFFTSSVIFIVHLFCRVPQGKRWCTAGMKPKNKQNIADKQAEQPTKKVRQPTVPIVASVELAWLEKFIFRTVCVCETSTALLNSTLCN